MKCVCVAKCDAGYSIVNTNWIVIREDDDRFSRLAAENVGRIRDVTEDDDFGDSTAYDYDGPENG